MKQLGYKTLALTLAACVSLAACSGTMSGADGYSEIPDPFEDVNRVTFQFNEAVDKAVLEPVARGYRAVTPGGIRTVVSNFITNLKSPIVIGNQLLQGDLEGAGNATARMVINTLAGFGGILDLADEGGIEHEPEDFGQTLATWGVGDGAYVVLPLLGPSSIRDASGMLVDSYADPLRIYLFNVEEEGWHYARVGATVLSERERLLDVVDDLRRNSFDYYAALRSAYYQNRQSIIRDEKAVGSAGGPEIPDYDDF
ncbi:MAG: VacJ family lipoprotein [Alphaproteobacteria bacterium]|nr:VacJ family lipoprotein [Alphaproteobacteria bacterium]